MAKPTKTNAMRLLDGLSIPYAVHSYPVADGAIDGMSVAAKTRRDPAVVFKTLVLRGASGGLYVFCIPVCAELPLKAAAKAAGEKNIAMLPQAELLAATGYVHGGCSPLAMKRRYPTFVHASAMAHENILVSGGKVGLQIELSPKDLLRAANAVQFDETNE